MTDAFARFGADLRLLDDLSHGNDRLPGNDLHTVRALSGRADLATLAGVDNLCQALLMRFMTRRGELAALGHADYGSRLYTLIGELNNATNRNRAKLFVLEALAAEPRVARVLSVDVGAGGRDRLDITMKLKTIDGGTPLDLMFPFFIGVPG
ncbi:GPW/gp25 family protein [Caballeronia novacaledonica]|uniref:Uncharacterized protein n=1 Tax=Caballeronia novacaledonica TaxID=1544861 RepID=A0AA37IFW6_9BURK|nr:GPW/gp25 family protein [Caballeronia novacaledonica]GJH28937.1 hypothetical protein CBA19CS42_30495 [Caballeronia novacaledonica]